MRLFLSRVPGSGCFELLIVIAAAIVPNKGEVASYGELARLTISLGISQNV
jgi:alkylated DNA nucleotide flippase Atl1